MVENIKHQTAQFALEQLMKTSAGEKLQQALQLIQTMQEHLTALSEKEEAPSVTGAKAATVLTLAVWKKIASGKRPSSFNQKDWKEIGRAILPDGEQYSIFVFQLYEKYIRASAEMIARFATSETVEAIMKLAHELHSKEELLKSGRLSETAYTEDCLWISLEAMIKLIESLGGEVAGVVVLIELAGLKGRERINKYRLESAICYEGK